VQTHYSVPRRIMPMLRHVLAKILVLGRQSSNDQTGAHCRKKSVLARTKNYLSQSCHIFSVSEEENIKITIFLIFHQNKDVAVAVFQNLLSYP